MSERMIFCLGEGNYETKGEGYQKSYRAFNKDITKDRYNEIFKEVREILKDLKLELNKEEWPDEWKKVTKEQWSKLSLIPEWDKSVVEGIIGFDIDLKVEATKELTVAEVSEKLGYAVKIIK